MRSLTEILVEALSETKIFEMAYTRENYLRNCSGLIPQIVQNWCLIKYCNLYDEENYNRLHWSKELIAHLENLRVQKLKGGLNKNRITKHALIEYAELDDVNMIMDILYGKWDDEGLSKDHMPDIAKEFISHLETICKIISNGSPGELRNYVYNEI